MAANWKIAPGDNARDWPLVSKLGCIGIGWLDGQDFRDFRNEDEIFEAIKRTHGENRKGYGRGAARTVFRFANIIRPNDIVVANKGYNTVVGVGIITSDYLPPTTPNNPLSLIETTSRKHARLVDWVVQREVVIPGKQFFPQPTLASLNDEKLATIREAYRNAYPGDFAFSLSLESVSGEGTVPATPAACDLGNETPDRVLSTTYRILRDTAMARQVKAMHNYACQICGHAIVLPDGLRYAEAHHIKPLGKPHGGPDTPGNILCLCPNHHAECDLGVRKLSRDVLRHVAGHALEEAFIAYHNENIWRAAGGFSQT